MRKVLKPSRGLNYLKTGIFCRPSCTARKPKSENVEFFATVKECILKGYRAFLFVSGSLILTGIVFLSRSRLLGWFCLIFMAVGKITWGLSYGGTAGGAIILPTGAGLLLCAAVLW